MSPDRALDVVVFGATGFVGRLTAEYLTGAAPDGLRVGLAGRSEERLAEVRADLGDAAGDWELVAADSRDSDSLARLAERTGVVVTTVGPYRSRGLPLVEACAGAGTHYADLTGEVLFMRETADRCHERAEASGARIVHACGFDSIPSDIGVLLLHEAAQADDAGDLEDTTLVVTAVRGGLSGGTFASMKEQLADVRASADAKRITGDPYALSPDRAGEPDLGRERDLRAPERDEELGIWVGPFVMAQANTRVVRRSNALDGWRYGRRFRYREVTGFGSGPTAPVKAAALTAGLGCLEAGLQIGPARAVLDRVLPEPGEGPSEETRRKGFFRIETHTRTSKGARYVCRIAARGDPGYAATAVMLGEAGLCLALDSDRLPPRGGVLTPATGIGTALADRLRKAGQSYEVQPAGR